MDSRHSAGPKLVFMPTSRPPNRHEDSRMYCVAQGGHSALRRIGFVTFAVLLCAVATLVLSRQVSLGLE